MFRFDEKRKKKDDEKRKNLSFIEINEREIETFQRIRHHEVREFNRSNKTFENERKSFENQNDFDYFFDRNNNFFLELIANLFFLETNLVKNFDRNIYKWISFTSQRHQNSSNSSFFDRTQNRAHIVCFREQKSWTYIQLFFSDSINRKSHRFDCSNYMCFESFWDESRCARSIADIRIRFKRDQITFEISQAFVSYIFANIDVLKHIINVDDCFNSSRHWKRKKKKKKKKRRFFDFLKIEQITKNDEKRNSDDRRNWKKKKKEKKNWKKKRRKTE